MITLLGLSASAEPLSFINVVMILPPAESWGRRLAWIRIPAWGVGDPGFKSQRPHHP